MEPAPWGYLIVLHEVRQWLTGCPGSVITVLMLSILKVQYCDNWRMVAILASEEFNMWRSKTLLDSVTLVMLYRWKLKKIHLGAGKTYLQFLFHFLKGWYMLRCTTIIKKGRFKVHFALLSYLEDSTKSYKVLNQSFQIISVSLCCRLNKL